MAKDTVLRIKEQLKIPGHQIERLANTILYWRVGDEMAKAHFEEELRQKIITNRSPFKTRRSLPHITLYGKVPVLKEFFLEKVIISKHRLVRICCGTRKKCRRY